MQVTAYIRLLRPAQWLKNLMIFFPPFLGATLLGQGVAKSGILPFVSFCLVSSATYIVNDLIDHPNDLHHPVKSKRPLPSGAVTRVPAALLAALLGAGGFLLAWRALPAAFLACLFSYLLVTLAYSCYLKEFALVDIFCISAGFLLRLEAGGAAFGIDISVWLFLSVFLLALFLGTGKRLAEKNHLGELAKSHRKSLHGYPQGYLEGVLYMSGAAVLVTYTMYVISRNSMVLVYTVPLCAFGLLRYILRILSGQGGDPTESLLRDVPLFFVGLAWAGMVGWGLYGR